MSPSFSNRDSRTYVASGVFVFLVILLMLFLTFVEIPTANKDLIVSIISMLVGGTGVAMGNLFGTKDEELEKMKDLLSQIKIENEIMKTQYDTLKGEYDRLTEMIVNRIEFGKK